MNKFNLTHQMIFAVFLGALIGYFMPLHSLNDVVPIGKMMINWVKILAGPLLFFTVAHSLMDVQIEKKTAFKLISIAFFNMAMALIIGLTLVKWAGSENLMPRLTQISSSEVEAQGQSNSAQPHDPSPSTTSPKALNSSVSNSTGAAQRVKWSGLIQTLSPASLFEPFVKNDILLIAVIALSVGLAARSMQRSHLKEFEWLQRFMGSFQILVSNLLGALVKIMPLAVLVVVAGSVNEFGIEIFKKLGLFVVVVLLGFLLQVSIVYHAWIKRSGRSIREFWRQAQEPILYSIGVNSSLATLPLTLKALSRLGVSKQSASLGAGVATNLNNDGIILYEASAALLVGLASGYHLGIPEMVIVALTCVIAALGITGVPEAGFISLSVVIATLGYPTEYLPLLLTVDWLLARARTVVNVMSDMTLSIAIDGKNAEPKFLSRSS